MAIEINNRLSLISLVLFYSNMVVLHNAEVKENNFVYYMMYIQL